MKDQNKVMVPIQILLRREGIPSGQCEGTYTWQNVPLVELDETR